MNINPEYITPEEWQGLHEDERQKICGFIKEDHKNSDSGEIISVPNNFYTQFGKRSLDILIGVSAFLITFPVNIILAIITYFDVGRPILFAQERIGKDGKLFYIVKFRNMTNETNDQGILLPPSQRVTKWGNFARRNSLDELMNFWNVIRGEMSIIGPRPLPQKYYDRFNMEQMQRHLVRPGLECPFHDDGNGKKGWERRLDNDLWYVENVSLKTDIRMLFLLIKKVFSKEERKISAAGMQSEFIGCDGDGNIITEANIPRKYLDMLKTGD